MSCKHEFDILTYDDEVICEFCIWCRKTLPAITLEQKLSAANARIAELETEKQEIQTNFNLFHASVQYILSPGVLDRKGWIEGLVNVKDVSKKYREEVLSRIEKAEQRAEQAEASCAAMQSVVTFAREYDTVCTQIHAMTEPIPGYMLDVARKARIGLHEALERMAALPASSSAQREVATPEPTP